jgi:hypothetical protein
MAVLPSCQVRGACSSCPVAARYSRSITPPCATITICSPLWRDASVCKGLDHAPAHGGERLAALRRPERVALAPALGLVRQVASISVKVLPWNAPKPRSRKPVVVRQRRTGRFGYGAMAVSQARSRSLV